MKLSHLLSVAIATVVAGAPVAARAKDHHGGSHHGGHYGGDHYHGSHGNYSHSYYPRIGFNFGYGYPYYGYGYGYGYPYYYRPTIGLAFSSYGSQVYRGVPASGYYSDSLAVDVQRELRERGYYRGAIDGAIGPASRAAIRAYQAERGLTVTGRIDSRLLRSLGIG